MIMFGNGNDNKYGANGAFVGMPHMKTGRNGVGIYFL